MKLKLQNLDKRRAVSRRRRAIQSAKGPASTVRRRPGAHTVPIDVLWPHMSRQERVAYNVFGQTEPAMMSVGMQLAMSAARLLCSA